MRIDPFPILLTVLLGFVLFACTGGGTNEGLSQPDFGELKIGQPDPERETIWDLFDQNETTDRTIDVNKYIWNAALDVLSFMPIDSIDPFSGVIVFGYGVPPGGKRAYRATVYIQDPALDARSLNLALTAKSGTVSAETQRTVTDAILNRARELRIADNAL